MLLSDFWETFERLLRGFWETFERLLRDFWETFERLLRDFWEAFERLLRQRFRWLRVEGWGISLPVSHPIEKEGRWWRSALQHPSSHKTALHLCWPIKRRILWQWQWKLQRLRPAYNRSRFVCMPEYPELSRAKAKRIAWRGSRDPTKHLKSPFSIIFIHN